MLHVIIQLVHVMTSRDMIRIATTLDTTHGVTMLVAWFVGCQIVVESATSIVVDRWLTSGVNDPEAFFFSIVLFDIRAHLVTFG